MRPVARVLMAALAAGSFAVLGTGAGMAQDRRAPASAQPQQPAPEPEPAPTPYEPQLLRLAEIMGSLAYLRALCGGGEADEWRSRMAALIEAEGRSGPQRERLTAAYNRGFRAYSVTHRLCTPVSQEASARLAEEGGRLSRALAGRYGG